MATVIYQHQLSGFKQQNFFILQFCRSQIPHGFTKIKVPATLCSSLDASKENLIFLSFLASSDLLLFLAHDMVLCLQSQWWQASPSHSVLSHILSSREGIPPSHNDVFLFSEYKACASSVTFILGTIVNGIVFIVLFSDGLLLVHRN